MVVAYNSISYFIPAYLKFKSVTIKPKLLLIFLKCNISFYILAIYSFILVISSSLGPISLFNSLIL